MPARHAAIRMALLTSAVVVQPLAAQPKDATMAKTEFEPLMGGCGGVYFMAQPGELVIEVLKRDRNARNTITELRAILVGADRHVLAEEFIPDDGEPVGSGLGPAQTVRLTAQVERPGIYASTSPSHKTAMARTCSGASAPIARATSSRPRAATATSATRSRSSWRAPTARRSSPSSHAWAS